MSGFVISAKTGAGSRNTGGVHQMSYVMLALAVVPLKTPTPGRVPGTVPGRVPDPVRMSGNDTATISVSSAGAVLAERLNSPSAIGNSTSIVCGPSTIRRVTESSVDSSGWGMSRVPVK